LRRGVLWLDIKYSTPDDVAEFIGERCLEALSRFELREVYIDVESRWPQYKDLVVKALRHPVVRLTTYGESAMGDAGEVREW